MIMLNRSWIDGKEIESNFNRNCIRGSAMRRRQHMSKGLAAKDRWWQFELCCRNFIQTLNTHFWKPLEILQPLPVGCGHYTSERFGLCASDTGEFRQCSTESFWFGIPTANSCCVFHRVKDSTAAIPFISRLGRPIYISRRCISWWSSKLGALDWVTARYLRYIIIRCLDK